MTGAVTGAVVMVTGASSGIGREVARRLAADGAVPVLVARREAELDAEIDRLRDQGLSAHRVVADLAEPDAPERVVRQTVERTGRIDGLVNNAAVCNHHPVSAWDVAEFDEHTAVNVRAPYFLVQQALPYLRESPIRSVVNISSSSGTLYLIRQSVYGMTKAALDYLTKSLAGELAETGVRVNCVAPGPIDTPIHATFSDDLDETYRWLREQVPLGRIGDVADVAGMVRFLLDPVSSYVTGAVIPVDGGQVIRP